MPAPFTPSPGFRRRVPVVLAATALGSLVSTWKATAQAVAELGVAVLFVSGIVHAEAGAWAPWAIAIALVLAALVRAADLESWGLLVPGGLGGRAETAFGPRLAALATAAVLAERLLVAAAAAVVIGEYGAGFVSDAIVGWTAAARLPPADLSTVIAVAALGALWVRGRLGRDLSSARLARAAWGAVAVLALTAVWAASSLPSGLNVAPLVPPALWSGAPSGATGLVFSVIVAIALALPVVGGGNVVVRSAHQFAPPRVPTLRRTAVFATVVTGLLQVALAVLFVSLVTDADARVWIAAPIAGITDRLPGQEWLVHAWMFLLVATAVGVGVPAAQAALLDADQALARLVRQQVIPDTIAPTRHWIGAAGRAGDAATLAAVLVVVASGGRIVWAGRACAFATALALAVKAAVVIRMRYVRPGPRAFRPQGGVGGRLLASGLWVAGGVAVVLAAALLVAYPGSALSVALLVAAVGLVAVTRPAAVGAAADESTNEFELESTDDVRLGQVEARPGNILVAVRDPHQVAQVAAALQVSGDRDVVVMTVRLLGLDADLEASGAAGPTPAEQRLFSSVVALAERMERPVRLLIVPAHDVIDALASTTVRLRSSEVHVGESETLAAADQARLLGDAWERLPQAEPLEVRLVIHHASGRADAYHLGAHPPALNAADLALIHRLWLDAVKTIGPHVHHHDVVRAALAQMERQMTGQQRDEALAEIRQVARPSDEVAAAVRARDFARVRDSVRNREASEVAAMLTELGLEEQVVVFRVLPRKTAATVFEYLEHDDQVALLRAMAQDDVASLLNAMAPDDRTMFLEELPAAATRQLLSLLTPEQRAVASTLLGYPEGSIGRLMTPHYIAVREDWSVREVLDHIREHGQDSETLNVVYVVDAQGALVDDIRIREFLLTSLDRRVSDLMDRRFAVLRATDDQETAVSVFRKYDRSALPVTDTAGMLIGIVTIDDVLDVAEASATEDIQRIGGSEALDEPYMEIGFVNMVRKRAGWLTALFLGEMLTASAMGVFEHEISKAVVLALFIPLIISSGGNSGSQASTLVIRALALGEVTLIDWWRVMRREIGAGLALGSILGSIGFLRITLWSAFSDIYGPHWFLVALTVAVALVGIVLWGTLVGSLLPFVLRRLGFDPATSSAPFVATLVDVTGLIIYFSVALVILRGSLL
jgi:magnesium transporter